MTQLTWETASDWDTAQSESGVVHESVANTDHTDATILKQGYPYSSFNNISPNPVAVWPLQEDSGSTAFDLAGANDGTINGPTLGQSGLLGTTAYSFDGVNDHVSTTYNLSEGDYTINVWAYPTTPGDEGSLVAGNDSGQYVELEHDSSDNWQFKDGSQNGPRVNMNFNEWQMVTAVYDDSVSDATLYANAGALGQDTANVNGGDVGGHTAIIGENFQFDQAFSGRIWEVRIYETTLTSSEVQTLYDVVNTNGTLTGPKKVA